MVDFDDKEYIGDWFLDRTLKPSIEKVAADMYFIQHNPEEFDFSWQEAQRYIEEVLHYDIFKVAEIVIEKYA